MKVSLFLCTLVFAMGNKCAKETVRSGITTSQVLMIDTVYSFEEDIKPILQSRCSPCHFVGGKMYERLPFDKPETLLNNSGGILKRIKDEAEARKIRHFIEQSDMK